MDSDALMSTEALARYVDVPAATVAKWRATGTGPRGIRVGKHVRYRREDIDAWLESRADEPQPA
jgi:excisionase family DNA binding protein